MKIFFVLCLFLFVLMAGFPAVTVFAQSTSETVSRLEADLKEVASGFASDLKWTAEEPDRLLREEIKVSAAKTLSMLDSLSAEINSAADIISKREANVSSGKLPQAEKKELLSILANQKAPLVRLRDRISQVRKKVDAIEKMELDSWKQTYTAFESIKGRDSAKEKLAGMMKTSLSSVPLLAEGYAKSARSAPSKSGLEAAFKNSGQHPINDSTAPLPSSASTSNITPPVQSGTPSKAVHPASVKDEPFFQFPRWFVVVSVLSVLFMILGGIKDSGALVGLGFFGIFLAVPIWLVWLVYLWVLRVIA